MINKITCKKIATFKDTEQTLNDLKQLNYFFGAKGTGKTTISNLIADYTQTYFTDCTLTWKDGAVLETRVYNRDFVMCNFGETLKGIFSLGEDSKETKGKIKTLIEAITLIDETHNIYFHNEVTYNNKRGKETLKNETFWLVKEKGNVSFIEKQSTNPVKTPYELLWGEVKNTKNRNNALIRNTLRRILENYFKMTGGIYPDSLAGKFDGDEKIKVKALMSWVNDGSHSVFDEGYYTPLTDIEAKKFLGIFKQIFEKSGHINNYNMMMGLSELDVVEGL